MDHKAVIGSRGDKPFTEVKADASGVITPPSSIHLLSVGNWEPAWHPDFEMTPADLAEMVVHFEEGEATVTGSKKLPVNYGHDITGKAAGWITRVYLENNGNELWGDVEWTPEGERMLKEGEFSFISPEWNPRSVPYQDPEDADRWLVNVLTGAGLTNIPLFKKLKPIMASLVKPKVKQASVVTASDNNNNGEPSMDLEALRAKKPEDLSDDEKKFVEEHKDELTAEERVKFGFDEADTSDADSSDGNDDSPGDSDGQDADDNTTGTGGDQTKKPDEGVQASSKAVSISADRLAKLEADAAAGVSAARELAETKARTFIAGAVSKGQIKTGDSGRWTKVLLASAGSQRTEIESLITGLPVNEQLGKENGDAGSEEVPATAELVERASKLVADSNGTLRYSEATKSLLASDKDLRERLNAERTNQTKQS